MPCIASEWGNLVALIEVDQANDAVCDFTESALLIFNPWSYIKHFLYLLHLAILFRWSVAVIIIQAWTEKHS